MNAHTAENGLPVDNLRQFLAERDAILCRTCMRPLTWETRTEPGFLPRQGWYDDARSDPIVCFRSVDYRHVPLTDREWAYYEAGRASVIPPAEPCRDCGPGYRLGDEGCRHDARARNALHTHNGDHHDNAE